MVHTVQHTSSLSCTLSTQHLIYTELHLTHNELHLTLLPTKSHPYWASSHHRRATSYPKWITYSHWATSRPYSATSIHPYIPNELHPNNTELQFILNSKNSEIHIIHTELNFIHAKLLILTELHLVLTELHLVNILAKSCPYIASIHNEQQAAIHAELHPIRTQSWSSSSLSYNSKTLKYISSTQR